jgi:hypothetical protein
MSEVSLKEGFRLWVQSLDGGMEQGLRPDPAQSVGHQPYTLHPTPYTLHLTPYTLHPIPYTITTCTLSPNPYTCNRLRTPGWSGAGPHPKKHQLVLCYSLL